MDTATQSPPVTVITPALLAKRSHNLCNGTGYLGYVPGTDQRSVFVCHCVKKGWRKLAPPGSAACPNVLPLATFKEHAQVTVEVSAAKE